MIHASRHHAVGMKTKANRNDQIGGRHCGVVRGGVDAGLVLEEISCWTSTLGARLAMGVCRQGCTTSSRNWSSIRASRIRGSLEILCSIRFRKYGAVVTRPYAMVRKRPQGLFRCGSGRKQMNEVTSFFRSSHLLATVMAMAVFPTPAGPVSQKKGGPFGESTQVKMRSRAFSRVPFRTSPRSNCCSEL